MMLMALSYPTKRLVFVFQLLRVVLWNTSTCRKHDVVTSEQGLFSIIIGQGALLGGEVASLLDIPWGSNTYFLKIELDTENNGSYMDFEHNSLECSLCLVCRKFWDTRS